MQGLTWDKIEPSIDFLNAVGEHVKGEEKVESGDFKIWEFMRCTPDTINKECFDGCSRKKYKYDWCWTSSAMSG